MNEALVQMTHVCILSLLISSFLLSSSPPEKGIVYFSYDNGRTWVNKSEGIPEGVFLSDIVADQNFLGLATKQHGVFVFDFQRNQWNRIATTPSKDDINVLYHHQNRLYAGTKSNGLYLSLDKGNTWVSFSAGLKNLTIRKIIAIDNRLYTGTNAGLFVFDNIAQRWTLDFGEDMLQVNGIRELDGAIYIGTNQGVFKKKSKDQKWLHLMPEHSLHNVGVDRQHVYALTYSELFISSDKGNTWRSDQKGMPTGMYSFQVMEKGNTVLAGQWDGVYVKTDSQGWKISTSGMPKDFPVLELVVSGDIIVAGSSQWSK